MDGPCTFLFTHETQKSSDGLVVKYSVVHRDRIRIGNEGFMWRDGWRKNGEPGEKSLEQGQEPVTQTNANHFTV